MKPIFRQLIISILFTSFCASPILAVTKEEVLQDAAEYFVKEAVRIPSGQSLYIRGIVNRASKERDTIGRDLESDLYFALEKQSPDFKIFLDEEPSDDENLIIDGAYTLEGPSTVLRLIVKQGLKKPRILAMFQGEYQTATSRSRMLVAILDFEASFLDQSSQKAFSEIMRGEFSLKGSFDIVNSADVDKLDSDAIQQASGCTRDECATIIGEQLGVDRVVSSSIYRVNDDLFVLSGKIINIRDGAIIRSRTVKHSGELGLLDESIEKLVAALIDSTGDVGEFVRKPDGEVEGDSGDKIKQIIDPIIEEFTSEVTNAFSDPVSPAEVEQEKTFNINVMRFGGPGLSWSSKIDTNSYWTTGISYDVIGSGGIQDDLILHAGYKYLVPVKLAIFNFHVGGSFVISRNEGIRYPYISMGTDFLFMMMGFDLPISSSNRTDFYFGFKFDY